jgi:threonine aldolase
MTDFRSDTLTKPTKAMLEAMFAAKVGDDVYGEDETVNALQEKIAEMFGFEAALFCPSGTMSNQIALRILTNPADEIICHEGAHVYKYEGGGAAANSGLSVRTLTSPFGIVSPEEVEKNINPDDPHFPTSKVLVIENSVNRGGGAVYDLSQIAALSALCKKSGLTFHLDGARIFNALTATGDSAREYGKYFDTISVCLSKGLGCPVGSLIISSAENIKKAKRVRKMLGGGMRQAGFLAAAGIYALDNHIERLKNDHDLAKRVEKVLSALPYVSDIYPVITNIIIFEVESLEIADNFANKLAEKGIKLSRIDAKKFRIVTHLDCAENADEILRSALA